MNVKFYSQLACTVFLFSTPSVQAQTFAPPETTITVGTPNFRNVSGLDSETISTAQIDSVLRTVAPSIFGQNFTRDKANKAFGDFANFRVTLASSLAQAIPAASSKIRRVNSVSISTNALNLRLSQKTNSVSGNLGTLSADISVLANGVPVICPSANASFSIKNIKISGDYNFISGDVSGTIVDYTVENISTSCNGFFGFIGDALNALTGIGSSIVRSAVASAANQAVTFGNMKQLFSIADFANGLHRFRTETPVASVANRAISVFQEMVNDASINTPGIVLDFLIEPANYYSAPNNSIKIIASSAPVDVEIPNFRTGEPIEGNLNSSISQPVDLYTSLNGGSWSYRGSTTTGTVPIPVLTNGTKLLAIGRNPFISGLESLPGAIGTFYLIPCKGRCIVS